jgi:hypothetical protein
MGQWRWLACLALLGACDGRTTSVRVEVTLAPGEAVPPSLSVSLYDETHALVQARMMDVPSLPGMLVLRGLADRAARLRVVVAGGGLLGAGVLDTIPGEQAQVVVSLHSLTADRDRDGVPDSIDNCDDDGNADQSDSDGDGVGDACPPSDLSAGPDLLGADLAGADLSVPADLSTVDLAGADLQGIDMTTADMTLNHCAAVGAVKLCEDFESGTIDATTWTAAGTVSVDTTIKHSGQRSLKVHLNAVSLGNSAQAGLRETKTFPLAGNTLYVRAWIYIAARPAGNEAVELLGAEQATFPDNGDYIFMRMTNVETYSQFSGQSASNASAPPVATWFCVAWRLVFGTLTAGSLSFTGTIPGATLANTTTTSNNPPIGEVRIGTSVNTANTAQPALDVYYDDIVIDDKALVCP